MSTITFSGLASNMDTDAIVEALVNVKEAQLIDPLENKVLTLQEKSAGVESFKNLFTSLQNAAATLNNSSTYDIKTATTSDTDVIELTSVATTASKGSYSLTVNALAQADRNYFNGVADKSTTQFGTGTIQITSDGVTNNIVIDSSNNTLEGIVGAINATAGINVTASIINDGSGANPYRLVLTANSTGADSNITQNISSILTLTDDAVLNADAQNTGQDASITVNALTVTSSNNTFSEAIPGVTFNVQELYTDALNPIKVVVSDNTNSMITKINSFVAAYNDVIGAFGQAFEFDAETGDSGALSSDQTIQQSQVTLHNIVFGVYNSLAANRYQNLSQLGITLDTDGLLLVNNSTLSSALSTDLSAVETLFTGTSYADGIAERVEDYLDTLTNSADGILSERIEMYNTNIQDTIDLIDEKNERIDAYEAMLKAKFANMEMVIQQLNNQKTALESTSKILENINKQTSGG